MLDTLTTVSQYIIIAYACLVFAKTMLMYGSLPVASAALCRKLSRTDSPVPLCVCAVVVFLVVPFAIAITAPKYLKNEKLRFFSVYRNFRAAKDIFSA